MIFQPPSQGMRSTSKRLLPAFIAQAERIAAVHQMSAARTGDDSRLLRAHFALRMADLARYRLQDSTDDQEVT